MTVFLKTQLLAPRDCIRTVLFTGHAVLPTKEEIHFFFSFLAVEKVFENASETSDSSKSKRQTQKVQPFLFFLQSLDIQVYLLSWRIQLGGFGSSRLATVAGKRVGGPSEEEDIYLQ